MLYVIIIGLSAFLLFQVQPMLARIILPNFGGGASIWLTSLIFFQFVLLLGYASSHFVVKKLGFKKHLYYQAAITLLSLLFLPLSAKTQLLEVIKFPPSLQILVLLLITVGLPYFVLTSTSPTVQYWIAWSSKKRNPYIQYAVSNAGSLAGLLIYPLWLEIHFKNSLLTKFWSLGYALYAVLILALILTKRFRIKKNQTLGEVSTNSFESEKNNISDDNNPISGIDKMRWLYLSIIPSATLMVITHHLTLDIASFPFLWVLPLSLYLISFVITFAFPAISKPGIFRTIFLTTPIIVLAPVVTFMNVIHEIINIGLVWQIFITATWFFAVSIFFHGELERKKPAPEKLTNFYLYLSLGGSLGGILIGIIAPIIFTSNTEFYLIFLIIIFSLIFPLIKNKRSRLVFQLIFVFLFLLTLFITETTFHSKLSLVTYRNRSFYAAYTVMDLPKNLEQKPHIKWIIENIDSGLERHFTTEKDVKLLLHGSTIHGGQIRDNNGNLSPNTYYYKKTAVGIAMEKLNPQSIGVIGLGTGVISAYGIEGQSF
jgi:hypothetical protein